IRLAIPPQEMLIRRECREIPSLLVVPEETILRSLKPERPVQPPQIEGRLIEVEQTLHHVRVVRKETVHFGCTEPITPLQPTSLTRVKMSLDHRRGFLRSL